MNSVQQANTQTAGMRAGALSRGVLYSLLGVALPLVGAVAAIPVLVHQLGVERFGILTLAWTLLGQFAMLDLGLSRAITIYVARMLGGERGHEASSVAWTGLALSAGWGVLLGAGLALLAPWLVGEALRIPAEFQAETRAAFYVLAAAVPLTLLANSLKGLLEAHLQFGWVNLIRAPMGTYIFVAPLAVLLFSDSLAAIMAALLLGLLATVGAFGWACGRVILGRRGGPSIQAAHAASLLRFGGWMTLSNLVGPIMVYGDRFLVGAMLSMAAVAHYTTPHELASRLWIIPGALTAVLLPSFSTTLIHHPALMKTLFGQGLRYTFMAVFPLCIGLVLLGEDGLTLWLGETFAREAAPVLRWLTVAVLINSLAHIPFALLQAADRPNLIAFLHIAELPCYLLLAVPLIRGWGIEGAAAAWTVRVAVDAAAIMGLTLREAPELRPEVVRIAGLSLGAVLVLLLCALVPAGLGLRLALTAGMTAGFLVLAWRGVMTPSERGTIMKWIGLHKPELSA